MGLRPARQIANQAHQASDANPKNQNNKKDDQKRILTPKEAIKLGADYLVIGRPITKSKNPLKTLKKINDTLS